MAIKRYSVLGLTAFAIVGACSSSTSTSRRGDAASTGGASATGVSSQSASSGGRSSSAGGGESGGRSGTATGGASTAASGGTTATDSHGSGGTSGGTTGRSSSDSAGATAGDSGHDGGSGGSAKGGTGGQSGGASGGATGQSSSGGKSAAAGDSGHGDAAAGGSSSSPGIDGGGSGAAVPSAGCGKTPTLKNSPSTTVFTPNNMTIAGNSREYFIRWPDDYDNKHPYRLIIGLHGAMGQGSDTAKPSDVLGAYFGLWDLAKGSTIFVAPSAYNKLWDATTDSQFINEILKTVQADLCIDTTRIMLQGFSQGAAMAWTLACAKAGVYRAAVGHSGGGVANPSSCPPIAYMGSLGLQEGGGQESQTDQFARWDACTIATLPRAPSGGHVCSNYSGCSAGLPVRWCSYDGGHTPAPTEQGQRMTWMSAEVWTFLSQF